MDGLTHQNIERRRIRVEGIVQGVGFRPFVFQLATRLGLAGWVRNDTQGVTIEVEGSPETIARMIAALRRDKPPLAAITRVAAEDIETTGAAGFSIHQSRTEEASRVQIAPDTYVCGDCLQELFDPGDRRFRYPFINCTNCGPRYTIVTGNPYDRPLTTMACFPMCADCLAEYENPASRRFHAQPNACPDCGPQLALLDANGEPLTGVEPLAFAVAALQAGKILAVKGLGGYHLAADAANPGAVQELRRRKQRDEKPFAVMAPNLDAIRLFAEVAGAEADLLVGPERPIVLLRQRAKHGLAEAVAPRNRYFGVMLPYTPVHHLLLEKGFQALVMTSANLTDEPIAYEDAEACQRLSAIADFFLVHNRRIHTRTDDSIARVSADRALLLRRSRGFVPRAIKLPARQPIVLAVGAELKNTICVTRADQAFLSQHIGDLKNLEVFASFKRTISQFRDMLEVEPEYVAHDLHPDYYSSRFALEDSGLPAIAIQHHHAHLASCLAEHGEEAPAIGVIFDGLGYGADGQVWGGEFLVGDLQQYHRHGHFRYQAMPGGDLATRAPWRMALSYLLSAYGDLPPGTPALAGIPEHEWRLVAQAVARDLNCPLTSSCGRLFDAVAALLGLRQVISFEGQAAMELEMIADPGISQPYSFTLDRVEGQIIFDPLPMLRAIVHDHQAGAAASHVSGRFHATLASMIAAVCVELRSRTGLSSVVLSGGVFQNCLLTEMTRESLAKAAFRVMTHSLVPPNDGGLALGQAVVAARHKH